MTSSNHHFKILISYNGFEYHGFQTQPQELKTIQDELNKALIKIVKSEDIRTLGSGRTDSGVHALGQVVKVSIPIEFEKASLKKALNSNLPKDIRVIDCERSNEGFHPIVHAENKEYWYGFYISDSSNPFLDDRLTWVRPGLDIALMKQVLPVFVGKHDFQNYFCVGTDINSTIRIINSFELATEKLPEIFGGNEYYIFKINGSGFLKQMVRLIVGTCFAYGRSKISKLQVEESLRMALDQPLGATAPAQGLYLKQVTYPR